MIFTYPLGTYVTVSAVWFPRSIEKCNLGLSAIKRKLTCHSCAPCSGPVADSAPTLHTTFPVPTGNRTKIHQNCGTSITMVLPICAKIPSPLRSFYSAGILKTKLIWKAAQVRQRVPPEPEFLCVFIENVKYCCIQLSKISLHGSLLKIIIC